MDFHRQIITLKKQILGFKRNLRQTDYKAIKFAEGELTEAEYAPIREQRKVWRNEINALEAEIKRLRG